jgi:hypothetical protein
MNLAERYVHFIIRTWSNTEMGICIIDREKGQITCERVPLQGKCEVVTRHLVQYREVLSRSIGGFTERLTVPKDRPALAHNEQWMETTEGGYIVEVR